MSSIEFPRAFAFAVDDLGWNDGSDISSQQGPYRVGVKRHFDIRDYEHMVAVGKRVGARIQCLFILSEMDRENILAKYPTTTYQRDKWDNSSRVNDEQKQLMNYVRDQAAYMEFGLHGTGHEYWEPGQPAKRAEWYNLIDRKPWPEVSLREHIQCFIDIMAQYGFSKENGHSFPESFVPCAYSYYWNPTGDYSLGKLLTDAGVKYANTDFAMIPELNPPKDINGGGFDYGTHVINRINYGNEWFALAKLPTTPLEEQQTDIIESHWANWLAQDDFLQPEVTQAWVDYYKSVQRMPNRYIAKNTEQLHSQWLYKNYTSVEFPKAGVVNIDNTKMPEKAYRHETLGNMVLKIKLAPGQHVSSASLNGELIPGYFEDEGYAFLYLPTLERKKYTLNYAIGTTKMPIHLFHDGSGNCYSLVSTANKIMAKVRVYGTQTIRVYCNKPIQVNTDTASLVVENYEYNEEAGEVHVTLHATDMQGVTGTIVLSY